MNIYAQTHIGLVRKTNEDRYLIKKFLDGSMLLAVADGLGGDVSGGLAADIIKEKLNQISRVEMGNEQEHLSRVAQKLDSVISIHAEKGEKFNGMGSTLICILVRNDQIYWVHIGDSRLYHFHNNQLNQITKDQTLARFLLKEGEISAEEYSAHYSQQVMDQYIGCGYSEPESGQFQIRKNDILLLSSDGLHKFINNHAIKTIIKKDIPTQEKVEHLIEMSLQAGGKDNVTVILAEVI